MCECHLEEVSILNVPQCILSTFADLWKDICNGNLNGATFLKNDRLYYIILIIILFLIVRLCVRHARTEKEIMDNRIHMGEEFLRHKYKQPNYPFWEMDARWNA